jgi:diphthine-ammonia ligase
MTAALFTSGGKDSTLALDRASRQGLEVTLLANIYEGSSNRVRFHGTPASLLEAQARALGLPLLQDHTHPDDFATTFHRVLTVLRNRGVKTVLFGNIHLADVRAWYEERTRAFGFDHVEPLWKDPPGRLVREFVERGYRSMICSVDLKLGKREWLGREFDAALIGEIEAHGADACGEKGEYHSFAFAGPLFRAPLAARPGRRVEMEGHALVEVEIEDSVSRSG